MDSSKYEDHEQIEDLFLKGFVCDLDKQAPQRFLLANETFLRRLFHRQPVMTGDKPVYHHYRYKSHLELYKQVKKHYYTLPVQFYPSLNESVNVERFYGESFCDETKLIKKYGRFLDETKKSELDQVVNFREAFLIDSPSDARSVSWNRSITALHFRLDTVETDSMGRSLADSATFTYSIKNMHVNPSALHSLLTIESLSDALNFVHTYGWMFLRELQLSLLDVHVVAVELYSHRLSKNQLDELGKRIAYDIGYHEMNGNLLAEKIGWVYKKSLKFYFLNTNVYFAKRNGDEYFSDKFDVLIRYKVNRVYSHPANIKKTKEILIDLIDLREQLGLLDAKYNKVFEFLNHAYNLKKANMEFKTKYFKEKAQNGRDELNRLVNFDLDLFWQRSIYERVERKYLELLRLKKGSIDLKFEFENLIMQNEFLILDAIRYDLFHNLDSNTDTYELFKKRGDKYSFVCFFFSYWLIKEDTKLFDNLFLDFLRMIEKIEESEKSKTVVPVMIDYDLHQYLCRDPNYLRKIWFDYVSNDKNQYTCSNHIRFTDHGLTDLTFLYRLDLISNSKVMLHLDQNFLTILYSDSLSGNRILARNLVKVSLANNWIRLIEEGAFDGLVSLTELDLSSNRMALISRNLFRRCHNLKSLKLSRNVIKSIDEMAFVNLTQLKALFLDHNLLTRVTKKMFFIKEHSSLEFLDLKKNKIEVCESEAFITLNKLARLNLASNNLTKFPGSLLSGLEQSLTTLTLTGNSSLDLKQLPQTRKKLVVK